MIAETRCRACESGVPITVLTLDGVPPADLFPERDAPVDPTETAHRLDMAVCRDCGLAQLVTEDTDTEEPLGIEPEALRIQAEAAIDSLLASGLLRPGQSVAEFRSPHGGSWTPIATRHGLVEAAPDAAADVVLDSFGMMHEPDQAMAVRERSRRTTDSGVLLLQFHSVATIVESRQWTALRHGHYAYYSLTALRELLAGVGMSITDAWEFPLYGGTVLIAARHQRDAATSATTERILRRERELLITEPGGFDGLQASVGELIARVRGHVARARANGHRCFAYGAASRAVGVMAMAGLSTSDIAAVADASEGKQGRRMPGTDIPIIAPEALVAQAPESVWLTLPDLAREVARAHPALERTLVDLG